MITKASEIIVNLLIKHSTITEEDRDLYQYGFFILMSQILYFAITLVFGLLFEVFIESIIFFLSFMLIRRYAGGFHAKTEISCGIMTTLVLLTSIIVIRISRVLNTNLILFIATIFSIISICVFCPLDTPEKQLTKSETNYYRKVSLSILLLISVIILMAIILRIEYLYTPSCLSLVLEGILLCAGKIKQNMLKSLHATK